MNHMIMLGKRSLGSETDSCHESSECVRCYGTEETGRGRAAYSDSPEPPITQAAQSFTKFIYPTPAYFCAAGWH